MNESKMYLLPISLLLFVTISVSELTPTITTQTTNNVKNTALKNTTTTLKAKTLETTTASYTTTKRTKKNAEMLIKVHSSTNSPGMIYGTTREVQPRTKAPEENSSRRKLNSSESALGGVKATPTARAAGRLPDVARADCDLPVLPRDSRLWRPNETHELNLPLTECPLVTAVPGSQEEECPPEVVSWEGAADIQNGDILIVRIADLLLIDNSSQIDTKNSSVNVTQPRQGPGQPAMYQVTRQGHEHCDIRDGSLLDVTALDENGLKIFTLYDKDLTEGVNLLIVVSEHWGPKCVRLKVTLKSDNCGELQECSGKGVCYTNVSMESFECECCSGFSGAHCEEHNACDPSPCLNNGICVDISQPRNSSAAGFHCLCPYGFTGKKCEKDPCYSSPCLNGGSCMSMSVNGSTRFHCACAEGWTGAHCQLSAAGGACASNPCNNGICIDQTDLLTESEAEGEEYKCYCKPGYTGDHCETEYNECESSPCGNGGTCTDRVAGYTCTCTRGYDGQRCHLKVDLCAPNPCSPRRLCIDHGNSYSCECPRGYVGEECSALARSACDHNPCAHGGTCWNGIDAFYCSCRPGYTGRLCEDNFIIESVEMGEDVEFPPGTGGGGVRELGMPLGLYHDRLHNVYIAVGTLGAAIAIVGVVVTACHCRVNKTYSRLLSRLSGGGGGGAGGRAGAAGAARHWLQPRPAPAPPALAPPPALDHDMYYTLEFSDSQTSPLIQ